MDEQTYKVCHDTLGHGTEMSGRVRVPVCSNLKWKPHCGAKPVRKDKAVLFCKMGYS